MPTALELTREERRHYRESARRALAWPEATLEEQAARARLIERIRQSAAELKARFGVRRVILFGSLARASWFTPDSDVDVAVEGLRDGDYWEAWRLVEDAVRERQVDFVELESAGEAMRCSIERHGVEM